MRVLAIESTCDETGAAVVSLDQRSKIKDLRGVRVLANVVASSAQIHTKYGGVVPEVAAREQIQAIIPVIEEAIQQATLRSHPSLHKGNDLLNSRIPEIDAIAVAVGPGLIGSLLIGVETAKALALAWQKPLIPVNHMAGHVFANWIVGENPALRSHPSLRKGNDLLYSRTPELPAVALVVSGGHTDLVYLKSLTDWEWIGGTRDDAAGECFDKCARILGLGYPGGPMIEKAAAKVPPFPKGTPFKCAGVRLPRPMIHEDNLDLSFSGLKSALDNLVRDNPDLVEDDDSRNFLARTLNEAVVEVLVSKTMRAVERYQSKSIIVAGGVAASALLRRELDDRCKMSDVKLCMPEFRYCTDNAAMIGASALLRDLGSQISDERLILGVTPRPGLETV